VLLPEHHILFGAMLGPSLRDAPFQCPPDVLVQFQVLPSHLNPHADDTDASWRSYASHGRAATRIGTTSASQIAAARRQIVTVGSQAVEVNRAQPQPDSIIEARRYVVASESAVDFNAFAVDGYCR
jgi:hypothetical protein